MRNFRHCFPGKIPRNLARVIADGIIYVYNHLILTNSPFGAPIFLGSFWCNRSQEMVLIEFLFAEKSIEDQECCFSDNMVTIAPFIAIVVFVLGGTSKRDFA
jgi:hypothetical protein